MKSNALSLSSRDTWGVNALISMAKTTSISNWKSYDRFVENSTEKGLQFWDTMPGQIKSVWIIQKSAMTNNRTTTAQNSGKTPVTVGRYLFKHTDSISEAVVDLSSISQTLLLSNPSSQCLIFFKGQVLINISQDIPSNSAGTGNVTFYSASSYQVYFASLVKLSFELDVKARVWSTGKPVGHIRPPWSHIHVYLKIFKTQVKRWIHILTS